MFSLYNLFVTIWFYFAPVNNRALVHRGCFGCICAIINYNGVLFVFGDCRTALLRQSGSSEVGQNWYGLPPS